MDLYTDLKQIGEGAYGTVFKGVNEKGEKCVIKINSTKDMNIGNSIMSLREYDILSRTKISKFCVNLNRVVYKPENPSEEVDPLILELEQGEGDGVDFIQGDYSDEEKRFFLLCVALGLEFLHSRNIIHYDLKPNNVLYFKDDLGKLRLAKLCDFGLSSRYSLHSYCDRDYYTLCYRAPEIFSEGIWDHRIDVWAFSILALEVMSKEKKPVIRGNSIGEIKSCSRQFADCSSTFLTKVIGRQILDHNKFTDMLRLGLKGLNWERAKISDIINHEYFSQYKDYISAARYSTGINREGIHITKPQIKVHVGKNKYRKKLVEKILGLVRGDLIAFHSVSLLDKYLITVDPKELTEEEIDVISACIAFITTKFFTTYLCSVQDMTKILNLRSKPKDFLETVLKLEKHIVVDLFGGILFDDYILESVNSSHPFNKKELKTLMSNLIGLKPGVYKLSDI